jgi:2-C-methyl-D-erythritol 2,4-cyclodiphosphate synthase
MGLLGHSDADVLLHAICDAVLGAIGAGDIGRHFPDSDPAFKGIDSRKLLSHVIDLAAQRGFTVSNIDATVIAESPKLSPYIEQMMAVVAADCRIAVSQTNIKATTTEGLGFAGRKEGIAAHAVVLMQAIV